MKDRMLGIAQGMVFGMAALCATSLAAGAQQRPPAEVGVITLNQQKFPHIVQLPGRAVAYQQVDIRPRVDGVITEKLYTPGQMIKAGTPLFQLDDASYAATVASDEADLAQAQADLPLKQAALARAQKLLGSGVTQADLETAQSDLASAKATLKSAEAALKYARTELSWTTVRSPIDGVVDVADVSVGDLVTAGQDTALTTVTTLDPIDVDMLEPSANLLELRKLIDSGALSTDDDLQAHLILEDGDTYDVTGNLVAPSSTVSTTTGTVSIRFRFENPEHTILPGAFVRGTVTLGTMSGYLVPQRAGEHGADGKLKIFVVGDDNKTQVLTVETEGNYQHNWIVRDGLKDGMKLVVDGQKNLQDKETVKPVAVSLNEKGLARTDGNGSAADAGSGDGAAKAAQE